jgi:hypothetical protein
MQTKILTIAILAVTLNGCGGSSDPLTAPVVAASSVLSFAADKTFRFTWADVGDATYYQLMENPDGVSGYTQVGSDIAQGNGVANHIVPLFSRVNAQYILKSCNTVGCTNSSTVSVSGTMVNSIVYLKASNTGNDDWFGDVLDVSADGNTLAVGAPREDSSTKGINDNQTSQTDNGASDSGAVYVFTKSNNQWLQEAYIKASNTGTNDHFGSSLSLSGDGLTLVVGAEQESSNGQGVYYNNDGDGDIEQSDNSASNSGAVYVFHKVASTWSQQAYLKSNNSQIDHQFGAFGALDVSDDGNIIAVGALYDDSGARGTKDTTSQSNPGNGLDTSQTDAGAAYIFTRSNTSWDQTAYIKASNTGAGDNFGKLSLSGDGKTLVVSAFNEDGASKVVSSKTEWSAADNNGATGSGAVYVFVYDAPDWEQEAYIKASNTDAGDEFGGDESLVISKDGLNIAVSAGGEDSSTIGINKGGQSDNSWQDSSAVYIFRKDAGVWRQEAYIKSEQTRDDFFGGLRGMAFNETGTLLAIASTDDTSSSPGVFGQRNDTGSIPRAGAVYVYTRTAGSSWGDTSEYTSYLKAPNTASDHFGTSVAMDDSGDNLVIGAAREESNATGVGGDDTNNSATSSGAVYVF